MKAEIIGFTFGIFGALHLSLNTWLTTGTAIFSFLIALVSLLVIIDKHTDIDIPFIHTDKEGKKKDKTITP